MAGVVNALIDGWDRRGLPEVCLILGDSGIDTAAVMLAAQVSGRVAVMLDCENVTSQSRELMEQLPSSVVRPRDEVALLDWSATQQLRVRGGIDPSGVGFAFLTSGSTGEPKIYGVVRTAGFRRIQPEAGNRPFAILSLRRPTVTSWATSVQWALRCRGTFVGLPLGGIVYSEIDRLLEGLSVTAINVTPTVLEQLWRPDERRWLSELSFLSLAGERVRPDVLRRIPDVMPNVLVRQAYGSTELGDVCQRVYSHAELTAADGPVAVGWPVEGIELRVVGGDDRVLDTGETGRIEVRGATWGFEGAITHEGSLVFQPLPRAEWLPIGDEGFLNPDGGLVVLGRFQESVKIRGSRISLPEVEEAIRATGLVSGVVVAVYPDAKGNDALGAVVVPSVAGEVSLAAIRLSMTESMQLVQCPTRLIVADELPALSTGKIDRRRASEMLTEGKTVGVSEPRRLKSIEDLVHGILCRVLEIHEIGLDEDIFERGVDSMLALEILAAIGDALGMSPEIQLLLENPTVRSLGQVLSGPLPAWGRIVNPGGRAAGDRIYWILPGANPYMVNRLIRDTPGFSHAVVLQLGALAEDVVLCDATRMVTALYHAIRDDCTEGHFVIVGFSSASFFATELAARFIDDGCPPSGLIVIDPNQHATLIAENRDSGKVANPWYVMLGREGRLASLGFAERDHALFRLQVFALSRFVPRPVDVPVLLIIGNEEKANIAPWSDSARCETVIVDQEHHDFIRKPESISGQLSAFLTRVLGAGAS